MTCHSQDLLRSWQLVYELLVKARTQVNVVLDKTTLGPFFYFYLGFGWNSTLKDYYVLSQLKKRLLLDTTGFGGTLTENDSMEKHLLPTLSKLTNQYFYSRRDKVIDDTTWWRSHVAVHTATSYKVTTRLRGHDTKSTFWPSLCLLYTVILIQELRLRTRDADTLFASVSPRVNTYPMQFLLSYEAHVSSLSLLHFEDSIKAADQISDKEPEGVQNSSGAACCYSRYSKLARGWLPYISLIIYWNQSSSVSQSYPNLCLAGGLFRYYFYFYPCSTIIIKPVI